MEQTNKLEEALKNNIMPVMTVSHNRWKTHSNAQLFPDPGEINTMPSMTVPDQSMTIEELVYRYTHGLDLGGGRVPVYDSESEIEYPSNWDALDISEKHDWLRERHDEYKELEAKLQGEKNRLAAEAREKEIEERVQEKIKKTRELINPINPNERQQGELPLE